MLSVQDEFKKRKKKQIIIAAILVPAMIMMVFTSEAQYEVIEGVENQTFTFLGLGAIIGGVIFSLINWRCPSCSKYLGKNINPKFCTHCGTELQ